MKILLINPPRVKRYPVVREERFEHKDIGSIYPPLSLLTTASVLEKEGFEADLIDANGYNLALTDIEKEIKAKAPDAVLVRIGFDTQDVDLRVIKIAKKYNIKTIVRNHIISRVPDFRNKFMKVNPDIDIFLNQEPEGVVIPLFKALENKSSLNKVAGISFRRGKNIIDNKDSMPITDLDSLPYPAYQLLPNMDVYYSGTFGPPFATILGSRGCPFDCAFCAYGHQLYRKRSALSIADEIEWFSNNFNIHEFCFLDDVVSLDPDRMIEISKEIIKKKLELRWSVGIRATGVNRRMLEWMKKAGCDEIAVGVESGSDKILEDIGKKITTKDVKKAAELCRKVGIKFYAMFIIGLPGETGETVMQSINLAKELKSFYTQFCFATPFPDTRIYSYYKKNNYLLTEDWSRYFPLNKKPVCRTEALSANDLMKLKNKAYRKTLFNISYLLRQVKLTDWRWNIRGLRELGARMLSALNLKPVR